MTLAAVVVAVLCSTVYAATPTATIDSSAKSTSTSPRFTDNANGTVKDNVTGLIWLKNANCFGRNSWLNAFEKASTLASGSCGLTDGSAAGDWRLPNRNELKSLIDSGQDKPTLPGGHPFVGVDHRHYYWARSASDSIFAAWKINLIGDAIGSTSTEHSHPTENTDFKKGDTAFVWPVRGGQ